MQPPPSALLPLGCPHAVRIEPRLRSESPENGNISNILRRLSARSLPQRPFWELRDWWPIRKSTPLARLSASIRGMFSGRRTGWLTSEDSNSHIPDWKKPFEMSGEFPHISPEFEAGDFRLPPKPRSADRTTSLTRVSSSKREYFRNQAGTLGPRRSFSETDHAMFWPSLAHCKAERNFLQSRS
jgi:hypothetical protein